MTRPRVKWRGVVKLQRQLNGDRSLVLMTNRDGSIRYERPIDETLERLFKGRSRVYMAARLIGTIVDLDPLREVETQDW